MSQELRKDELAAYVMFGNGKMKLFINDHNEYTMQVFKYGDSDWGTYEILDKEETSMTHILFEINKGSTIYKSVLSTIRKLDDNTERLLAQGERLEDVTNEFKVNAIKNFNDIIKRIYGVKYDTVIEQIASNISVMDSTTNKNEILKLISDRAKLRRLAREYELAMNDKDMLKLNSLDQQYNSLLPFNEFLINFEVMYSDLTDDFLTIKDIIDKYGVMKTTTSFLCYLYSGKIMKM